MINRIKKKLNNKKGESLTEVLVAVLIGCMALALLAAMVSSSSRIISESEKKMNAYYLQNNKLENKTSGSTSGTASFSVNGSKLKITDSESSDINLKYYKNEQARTNTPVYSYTK